MKKPPAQQRREERYRDLYGGGAVISIPRIHRDTGIPVQILREAASRAPAGEGTPRAVALVLSWVDGKRGKDRDLVEQLEDLLALGASLVKPGAPSAGCTNRAVQTLLFAKAQWTKRRAQTWVRKHKQFSDLGVVETVGTFRFRQREPRDFDRDTFRTIPFGTGTGIQAIVACPLVTDDDLAYFINPRVGGLNMTADALRAWAKDPRSALASTATGQQSLRMLPKILERYQKGAKLTQDERAWMKKTKDFNWRHLRQNTFGAEVKQSGYSARHIALRNWGHDPTRTDSPAYLTDQKWLRKHPGAASRRK